MDHRPALELIVRPLAVSRLLSVGLGVGLLVLLDSYLLLVLARHFGTYLLLAGAAFTSLTAAFLTFRAYRFEVEKLGASIQVGRYPRREYIRMLGLLVGGGLLVIPGFATDLIGLLICIRPVGSLVGLLLERTFRARLQTLYEFLRLEY